MIEVGIEMDRRLRLAGPSGLAAYSLTGFSSQGLGAGSALFSAYHILHRESAIDYSTMYVVG